MMINHPVQVGRIAAALTLISYRDVHIGCRNNELFVDERHQKVKFDSEEDLMVWLLEQIKESAQGSLEWFSEHRDVNDTTTSASTA
jgi:hypothetical protein